MHNPVISMDSLPDGMDSETLDDLKQGVDIFLFSGDLDVGLERALPDYIQSLKANGKLALILTTPGGSADAAYSVARKLDSMYERFEVFVNGYCKSAGTLLALGANELVITPEAEFGPLDVQLFCPDEFVKRSSGLTLTQAMKWVNDQSFEAFEHIFLNLRGRSGGNITTKTAGEIAAAIVGSLYGSITDKIDPVSVGEMQRAIDIAVEYGRRLGIPESLVNHLVSGYPSHGFVIDWQEARQLFPNTRLVRQGEWEILNEIGGILHEEFSVDYTVQPNAEGIVAYIDIKKEAIDEAGKNETDKEQTPDEEVEQLGESATSGLE